MLAKENLLIYYNLSSGIKFSANYLCNGIAQSYFTYILWKEKCFELFDVFFWVNSVWSNCFKIPLSMLNFKSS